MQLYCKTVQFYKPVVFFTDGTAKLKSDDPLHKSQDFKDLFLKLL